MSAFKSFPGEAQAAKLVGDTARLEQLKNAPETQKIFSMLERATGGSLEQAAGNAARGDTTQLLSAIRQLMADPEGAKLMERMREKLK